MNRVVSVLMLAIIAASFTGAARAQMYATAGSQQYALTDIGNLSSQFPYASVNAINSFGQVVGDSNVSPSDGAHGYYYGGNGSAPVDLGSLGGNSPYVQSLANGLNDSSWIVGSSGDEACVWLPQSGIQGVGFLGSGNASALNQISNDGVAVGGSTTLGSSYANAIVWSATTGLQDLNSLIANPPPAWAPTDATAISQNGAFIAGIGYSNITTDPPSGSGHAFTLNGGSLTEIPDPGVEIFPRSVTSAGEVVGFYFDASEQVHAFVYTPALGTQDIGNLGPSLTGSGSRTTEAFGINDLGQVVGADDWVSGDEAAFLWTDSAGIIEIDPPTGVVFDGAYSINNSGQIIAQGYYADDAALGYRGFVLTPTPEPNSILLLAASAATALLTRVRRFRGKRFVRNGSLSWSQAHR